MVDAGREQPAYGECTMILADIMTRAVVTVHLDDTLEHIRSIFESSKFHHLLVTDNGELVGVISDRDLLKHVSPFIGNRLMERNQDVNTLNRRAHQIMSRKPVTCTPETSVYGGLGVMLRDHVSCLPVVYENSHIAGIVSWRDILRALNICDANGAEAA